MSTEPAKSEKDPMIRPSRLGSPSVFPAKTDTITTLENSDPTKAKNDKKEEQSTISNAATELAEKFAGKQDGTRKNPLPSSSLGNENQNGGHEKSKTEKVKKSPRKNQHLRTRGLKSNRQTDTPDHSDADDISYVKSVEVNHIIQRLFMDIPSLKVGVIAHGDYCDATTYYVTKQIDFTNDIAALCDFVKNTGGSGGGDYAECYELVLQKVRTSFDWTPGSQKSLVMIGDAIPHEPNYPANKGKINWRTETKKLYEELGVKIYGVQCQDHADSTKFFKQISSQTGGKHLKLAEFQTIIDMMMAICYREHGVEYFEAYEKEVREREGKGMRGELTNMFDALRDPDSHDASDDVLTPIIKSKKKSTPKKAPRKFKMSPKVTPKAILKPATTPKSKVVKRLKMTTKKTSPSSEKTTKVHRHPRENVAEIHFSCATLDWSPWKPVSNILEFRSIYSLKQNLSRSRSFLYELAVQTKPYTRRFPIYIKLANRCLHSTNGPLRMYINNDEICEQLENVDTQGCKLFARWLEIKRPVTCYGRKFTNGQDLKKFLVKSYDYAWCLKSMKRSEARNVNRCGVLISKGSR